MKKKVIANINIMLKAEAMGKSAKRTIRRTIAWGNSSSRPPPSICGVT